MASIEPKKMMGKRFGILEVQSYMRSQRRGAWWVCKCDCGRKTVARGDNLRSGRTRSCGCQKNRGLKYQVVEKRFPDISDLDSVL